jgi:hypothetical protein
VYRYCFSKSIELFQDHVDFFPPGHDTAGPQHGSKKIGTYFLVENFSADSICPFVMNWGVMRSTWLPSNGHFPPQKKELTPIAKTPNPGIIRALISVSLQKGLQLCENDPLFDRKLLDYLYEQGVRCMLDKTRCIVFFLSK